MAFLELQPALGTIIALLLTALFSLRLYTSGWPSARRQRPGPAGKPVDCPTTTSDVTPTGVAGKTDETGHGPAVSKMEQDGTPPADIVASAFAVVERVRALGLHLGDIHVTGVSVGLPNEVSGRPVFDKDNLDSLLRGESLIGVLPSTTLRAQLERNIVQVVKGSDGTRQRRVLKTVQVATRPFAAGDARARTQTLEHSHAHMSAPRASRTDHLPHAAPCGRM